MTDRERIMQEIIPAKLQEIEQRENIQILHCVESGSRAWGFASPDSDYDVRFIYVRPLEYYLRLDRTRDVIEWQLDDTLDINGWDLQKALACCTALTQPSSSGTILPLSIRPPQSGQRFLRLLITISRRKLGCTTISALPRKTTVSTSRATLPN